jgi:hypothetical protein
VVRGTSLTWPLSLNPVLLGGGVSRRRRRLCNPLGEEDVTIMLGPSAAPTTNSPGDHPVHGARRLLAPRRLTRRAARTS